VSSFRRSDGEAPLFREATSEAGIDFIHRTEPPGSFFFPEVNGSGAAFLDFDLDGDLDIYLVNLGTGYLNPGVGEASDGRHTNRLYEQIGIGRFEDVTAKSGLGDAGYGTGVAVGDVNNDGFPDVYVTNYGPDRLYVNRGDGSFSDVTDEAGIDNPAWGVSACFFDYDRDGWLDLFVANYIDYHRRKCTRVGGGDEDFCGPQIFAPVADRLFRNMTGHDWEDETERRGADVKRTVRLEDVTLSSGISTVRGPGMAVTCGDFNQDTWPDLLVGNDRTANFLWINQKNGSFSEEALLFGLAYDPQGNAQASMGVTLGDVDGDNSFDVFLTHLDGERNALCLNERPAVFHDATVARGTGASSLRDTGFGTALFDIEHDGDLDLAIANGAVSRPANEPEPGGIPADLPDFWRRYAQPNRILLNDSTGQFRTFFSARDPFVSTAEVSRGLAVGDLDNDGDVDLLVTNTAGRARLYCNDAPKRGGWLILQAVNPVWGGRDDYGAVVTVTADDQQWKRLIQPAYSYQCSNDPRAHFGLGAIDRVDSVTVVWSDGEKESFPGCSVNQFVVLERGKGTSGER